MADVKNFGLIGVGSSLQFSKAGPKLVNGSGVFNFKQADGTTDTALTAAGITSSAGNVTLTTGNLVLTSTSGALSIGGTNMIVRNATTSGVQLAGTSSVVVPTGITADRGTGVIGAVRVNSDAPAAGYVEFYNGTTWMTLATGGDATALQTEVNNIETTLGSMVNSDGTSNVASALTNTLFGSATDLTTALQNLATGVQGKDTLDEIFPSGTSGAPSVIYSDAGGSWAVGLPGATSGVQGYDAGLTALAVKTTTGILVQTGADTYTSRSLVAPTEGITIANPDGVAGAPTFALANDLAAVEGLITFGYAVRTAADTWTTRTIAGVSGQIVITDGNGVLTNTDIGLATVTNPGNGGTFVTITTDAYGRVTNSTAVTTANITALADSEYLRLDGTTTMTADLNAGGFKVIGLAEPTASTDAATKNYVDNATTGLTWKTAVLNATTANVTLSGEQTIDGVLTSASRILVKNQTDPTENGIYVTAAGAWARSTDANTGAELDSAAVFVQQGTTQADSGWVQTTSPVTLGTSNVVFSQFSGAGAYTGGTGIDITGNVISAKLGAGITNLPTGEIGADVASGVAVQLTSTTTGGQLTFVLDTGSGLEQSATGLKISATGVTNAMLENSAIGLNSDVGTGSVDLGGTLLLRGDGVISTDVAGDTYTISVSVATSASSAAAATLGVASFDSGNFTSAAGFVTLNTVDTAHGGTGLTGFALNELFYAGSTSTMDQSANLSFDGTSTLTVGGALPLTINGATGAITATASNSDLVLMPNGTGSVIVGPAGSGLIQSDSGTDLTVRGNTALTLETGDTDIVMLLPAGTGTKVTVGGANAIDYATGLAPEDLTNKQYVDDAIASGASAGAVKAYQRTIPLNANGTTAIPLTGVMPAGATVLSVKVNVTTVDTGATLSVGKTGSIASYMTTGENDPQTQGLYVSECFVTEGSATGLIATVASSSGSGSGSCVVIVTYQVAQ